MQWLHVGDRVGAFSLESTDGTERGFTAGNTVVVFCATWSPASMNELERISVAAGTGLIHWSVLPVCVDDYSSTPERRDEITNTMREQSGYTGPIWFDQDLELFSNWGVVAVPTVVVCDMGRQILFAERGWTEDVQRRLLAAMGKSEGDTSETAEHSESLISDHCRSDMSEAMRQRRLGRQFRAVELIGRARASCTEWVTPRVLLAYVCWASGKPYCARREAEAAFASDASDSWSVLTLAAIQLRSGQPDSAIALAGRAIALDSTLTPAWSVLGRASLATGDTAAAARTWERIRSLNRHDPGHGSIAAVLYEERRMADSAVLWWRRTVEDGLR
jgi:hypothetical protein